MKRKRCSLLILAMALLIIGAREVCMAQYSGHVSIEKSTTQERNFQLAIPINRSEVSTERVRAGLARVKRYGFAFLVRKSSSPISTYSSHKKAYETQSYSKIICAFCASLSLLRIKT